jgi:hypothetical protein
MVLERILRGKVRFLGQNLIKRGPGSGVPKPRNVDRWSALLSEILGVSKLLLYNKPISPLRITFGCRIWTGWLRKYMYRYVHVLKSYQNTWKSLYFGSMLSIHWLFASFWKWLDSWFWIKSREAKIGLLRRNRNKTGPRSRVPKPRMWVDAQCFSKKSLTFQGFWNSWKYRIEVFSKHSCGPNSEKPKSDCWGETGSNGPSSGFPNPGCG